MAELSIEIKVLSPIHLGSGQAEVNIDSEIVHDAQGFPYFPAKRFKANNVQLIVPNFFYLPARRVQAALQGVAVFADRRDVSRSLYASRGAKLIHDAPLSNATD